MAHDCPAPSCPNLASRGEVCCRSCWANLPMSLRWDVAASMHPVNPPAHLVAALAVIAHLHRHG